MLVVLHLVDHEGMLVVLMLQVEPRVLIIVLVEETVGFDVFVQNCVSDQVLLFTLKLLRLPLRIRLV